MKMETKGQMATGLIWSVGVGLIVLSFVGLVVGTTQERAETIADDDNAANFSHAENLVDEAGTTTTDNFPMLGLVVTITIVAAIILILRQVI